MAELTQQVTRLCPNCGDLRPGGAHLCPHCGAGPDGSRSASTGMTVLRVLAAICIGLVVLPLGALGACTALFGGLSFTALSAYDPVHSAGFAALWVLIGGALIVIAGLGCWLIVRLLKPS